jgi:hypothetical protein
MQIALLTHFNHHNSQIVERNLTPIARQVTRMKRSSKLTVVLGRIHPTEPECSKEESASRWQHGETACRSVTSAGNVNKHGDFNNCEELRNKLIIFYGIRAFDAIWLEWSIWWCNCSFLEATIKVEEQKLSQS